MYKNKYSAFTMLELIVVISMMAIVLSISAPRIFKTLYRGKLRSEANNLMTTLKYSQGMAAVQRATFRVHFNLDNQEYYVTRDAGRGDDFELTDDDLTSSGSSGLFPGESTRYMPDSGDDRENKNDDWYDEENTGSNRNSAGRVSIFEEETHKLPGEIKILKIVDGRGDEMSEGTFEIPLDSQGRSFETTIYFGKSDEDKLKYLVHIGANGIVEVITEDDETN
jgi:type II secretory pathway pseudopilin PulG